MWKQNSSVSILGGYVSFISVSPDGSELAFGHGNGNLSIMEISTLKILLTKQIHEGPINFIKWHPNSKALATASDDSLSKLIRRSDLSPIINYNGTNYPILCVDINNSGNHLVTGGYDTAVRCYDLTDSEPVQVIGAHSQPVCSVCFSSTGSVILTASYDGLIRFWDFHTQLLLQTFNIEDYHITCATFSPNYLYFLAAYHDNKVRLTKINQSNYQVPVVVKVYEGHQNQIENVQTGFIFHGNEMEVFVTSENGNVVGYDFESCKIKWEVETGNPHSSIVAFSPDGNMLFSIGGQSDDVFQVWKREE